MKNYSLVNLIAGREVVKELVADTFSTANIASELGRILPDGDARRSMTAGYDDVRARLGDKNAPDNAADIMIRLLRNSDRV